MVGCAGSNCDKVNRLHNRRAVRICAARHGCSETGAGAWGDQSPAGPRYHHYVFELYALSKMLDLPVDATRAQLLDAMKDIIVGKAAYVGRFRQ